MSNKKLKILLASPRGFCAGVERAIEIVKKSVAKYGPPVYVRHEIVHNKYVVDSLKNIGAIFVEELDEIENEMKSKVEKSILDSKSADFPTEKDLLTDVYVKY